MENIFRPLSFEEEIRIYRRHLPHWEQKGGSYFVTFRTADSLPAGKVRWLKKQKEIWIRHHPEPWSPSINREYSRHIFRFLDRWLDQNEGACPFANPDLAQILASAMLFFDETRYYLDEFAVMPNHCHTIFLITSDYSPEEIMHSWKSYSGNQINRALGKKRQLWMHESFDRLIRNRDELERYREYIRRNPQRAGLREGEYLLGKGAGIR